MDALAERPPAGHGSAGQAARALAAVALTGGFLLVFGLIALPSAVVSHHAALAWCKRYCRAVLWVLRVLCNLRTEIRGPVPAGSCIIAAKHQSFLDVIMLVEALPQPRFVMKRSLLWVPVVGYFARRIGCVAIDRSAGGEAVRSMIAGLSAGGRDPGQIVIFPQGTRVAPGGRAGYRAGVLKLYAEFRLPVTLAAANTGWFWPRTGTRRSPGTAVVEFLETIPPGQPTTGLLARIEEGIEAGSDRLAGEAAAGVAARAAAHR